MDLFETLTAVRGKLTEQTDIYREYVQQNLIRFSESAEKEILPTGGRDSNGSK